jgi:hypothetical protein
MMPRRWVCPILFSLIAAATWFAGGAHANRIDRGPVVKTAKAGGKWRIAWDVRLGTVRGILTLKQSAAQLTGTFEEYGKTYPLTGSIQGQDITFEVPFSGPRPYTIEFKGAIDGPKMAGTSGLKGGGHVFLGHAGEVDEPQRPWTATRGLKHQNNAPGKPPDDDDDDDRRRPTIGLPTPGRQVSELR